ncbi:unnamed protein product [Schistosoma rodhaini]|uniref:Uncharacterized protein n=1 Tax=Schistosoma mansoni TaxID=6183 RepID=G4V901_SCHMA|nr:hypothetical protein Smp_148630 [Schistosoma mansoni]CAH8482934.1 unnamed protein product [Schistosoma rodhaini]|eukprot:XP_018649100.1 hypothetical protein Smp_148630 [Schistosoma mansoni]
MYYEIDLNSLTTNNKNCSNKKRIQKEKRLYSLDNLQYIYARLCIIDFGGILNSMNKQEILMSLTSTELCFAIRRAIDTTIKDLFGEFSGLPILNYDLLFCRREMNDNDNNDDDSHASRHQLTNSTNAPSISWSILLAVPYTNVEKIIAALSFMTNELGGLELINKLFESIHLNNDSLKFYVDVISVSDSLFNLPCIPIYKSKNV